MKIGVLTSSRADYGIYLPLLKAMSEDPFFDVRIIAFGTHLSSFHGRTVDAIIADGFTIDHKVAHILTSDTPEAIATSMSIATGKFSEIWNKEKDNYDTVLCLGDRYEMFAAVSAGAPFGIRFAHFHGGETTLGAIDNEFRHCISLFSSIHFVATEAYALRVSEIKGNNHNIHVTGSLSLNNIDAIELLSAGEFRDQFNIDLDKPSAIVTFHAETVDIDSNERNAQELVSALNQLRGIQIIITMPNADAMGNTMRKAYEDFAMNNTNVVLVENLGSLGYFSCMKLCRLVIGNSSSGIIEAASFHKYVVNIGNRQSGRDQSRNVLNCPADEKQILHACYTALAKGKYMGENIYYREGAIEKVLSILRRC